MPSPLETAAPKKHWCMVCGKAYSTNSHLRRHEATHTGRQELTCPLCQAQFTRRDLARRHVHACSAQGYEVTLPTLKRGRKPLSCDSCSRRKLSCDKKRPCMRCCSDGTRCTYERMDIASSCATSRVGVVVRPNPRQTNKAEAPASGNGARISIDFLLNFTDPSGDRPSATIAAEATNLNIVGHDINSQILPIYTEDPLSFHDQSFANTDDSFSVYYFPPFLAAGEHEGTYPGMINNLSADPEILSTYEVRAKEMLSQILGQQPSVQERNIGAHTSPDTSLASEVFSSTNIQYFVWAYFHHFHNQFPILHRASFDIRTVSLLLLLTIVLVGSMSRNPSDISLAIRQFFDIVEAHVFDQMNSRHMLRGPRETWTTDPELELLQAGLLFIMLQNNSNDPITRRRLRLQRLPSLIATVRASGLFAYKHRDLDTSSDESGWRLFISDEIRVRLATWTFLIDSTVALFFNSPPLVAISEMTGDLPCEENLFKAETALEFEHIARMEHSRLRAAALSKIIPSLVFPSSSGSSEFTEEHMSAPTMLIVICAIQSMITTSRMSFLAPATFAVILSALDRWKDLWDVINEKYQNRFGPHEGFEKHSGECWWLAKTILKISQLQDSSCRYMQPVPSDSAEDLHDFIRTYKDYAE